MTDQDGSEDAYAPPQADNDDSPTPSEFEAVSRGLRVAGGMVLTGAGVNIAFAVVEACYGMTVSSTGGFVTIAAVGIGAGLWLRGKPFRLPALAYLGLDVTLPILNALRFVDQPRLSIFGGAVIVRFIAVSPVLLVLLGRPGRRRIQAATLLFAIIVLATTLSSIWRDYEVVRYLDHRG